jgi:hypothetical protein
VGEQGPKDSLYIWFSPFMSLLDLVFKANASQNTRCVYAMPIHPSLWRQKSPALLKAIVQDSTLVVFGCTSKEGGSPLCHFSLALIRLA